MFQTFLTSIKMFDCQSSTFLNLIMVLFFFFLFFFLFFLIYTNNTGDRCTPNEWFTLEPIKNEESVFAIRHYSTCQLLNVGKDDSIGFADGKLKF